MTTPVGGGFTSVNVGLRKALELFANLRPVWNIPSVPSRYEGVDLVIVRENTEDLYAGLEHEVVPGVVESLKIITEEASTRVARVRLRVRAQARPQAGHRGAQGQHHEDERRPVPRSASRTWPREYPDIVCDERIVDAACMHLVMNPTQFDVLLLPNLYGDIVSDLCAGLVGGLGVVPAANLGVEIGVFEAVHGSAPDIAGKSLANPMALLLSALLMLRHIDEGAMADRIMTALGDGAVGRDRCGRATSAARRAPSSSPTRSAAGSTGLSGRRPSASGIVAACRCSTRSPRPCCPATRSRATSRAATARADARRASASRPTSKNCARRSATRSTARSSIRSIRSCARSSASASNVDDVQGGDARRARRLRLEPPQPHRLPGRAAGARRQRRPAADHRRRHQPVRRPARPAPPPRHRRASRSGATRKDPVYLITLKAYVAELLRKHDLFFYPGRRAQLQRRAEEPEDRADARRAAGRASAPGRSCRPPSPTTWCSRTTCWRGSG